MKHTLLYGLIALLLIPLVQGTLLSQAEYDAINIDALDPGAFLLLTPHVSLEYQSGDYQLFLRFSLLDIQPYNSTHYETAEQTIMYSAKETNFTGCARKISAVEAQDFLYCFEEYTLPYWNERYLNQWYWHKLKLKSYQSQGNPLIPQDLTRYYWG